MNEERLIGRLGIGNEERKIAAELAGLRAVISAFREEKVMPAWSKLGGYETDARGRPHADVQHFPLRIKWFVPKRYAFVSEGSGKLVVT